MPNESDPFIFWLLGWSFDKPAWLHQGKLVMCTVSSKELAISSDPILTVPIAQIRQADVYLGGGIGMRIASVQVLVGGTERNLYLTPCDPLVPTQILNSRNLAESDALLDVIRSFQAGIRSHRSANPYERVARTAEGGLVPSRDPSVSPLAYETRIRVAPSSVRLLLILIIVILMFIIFALIAAALLLSTFMTMPEI